MAEIKKINTDLQLEGKLLDGNGSAGTSGQVLSSTGTATDWVSLSEISGVDGTGTANYVTKWSDADTVTNSVIYDDGSKVLIGATSSAFSDKLYLHNSSGYASSGWRVGTTSTYVGKLVNSAGVLSLEADGVRSIGFRNTTNGDIVRIDGVNSRVGIGTTSPDSKLDIRTSTLTGVTLPTLGTSAYSGIHIVPEGTATTEAWYGITFGNTAGSLSERERTTAGIFTSASGGYGNKLYFATSNSWATGAVSRMMIDHAGNVGIGTTSPSQKLDVQGTVLVNNEIQFVDSNMRIFRSSNDMRIRTGGSDKVTIDSSGNVGIGTTSPSEKLEVAGGNIKTSGGIYVGGSLGFLWNNDAGSNLRFGASGGEKMRITSNGNVGIGTTNPTYKLEVAGTIAQSVLQSAPNDDVNDVVYSRFFRTHTSTVNEPSDISSFGMGINLEYSADNSMQIMSDRGANTALYMRKQSNGSWSSWLKIRDNNQITDTDISNWDAGYANWSGVAGGGDWNNIDTNAFIRGHTTTLNYPPELSQSFLSGLSVLYDADDGWQLASQRSATANLYHRHVSNGTWASWRRILDSDDIYVDNSNGNVGIGTTSPEAKMHIKINDSGATPISQQHLILENNSATGLGILTTSSTSGYIFFGDESDAQRGFISYTHPTDHMAFKTNGAERLRITSSGAVGIGTTSPAQTLDVSGSVIFRPSGTSDTISFLSLGSAQSRLVTTGNFAIWPGESEAMRLLTNGNVGIGTSSPAKKLEVNGTVHLGSGGNDVTIGASNSSVIFMLRAGYNYIQASSTSGQLVFRTGGPNNRMVIDSTGNVGIGTTSPRNSLDVQPFNGKWRVGDYGGMYFQNTSDSLNERYIHARSDGGLSIGYIPIANLTGGSGGYASTSYDDLYIDSSGNVGIGTTSPSQKLHISGNSLSSIHYLNDNTKYIGFASPYLQVYSQNTAIRFRVDNGNNIINYLVGNGGSFTVNDTAVDLFSVTKGASAYFGLNLGIGTPTPAAPLSISNGGAEGIELNYNVGNEARILSYNRSNNTYRNLVLDSAYHRFKISGNEVGSINGSGNVTFNNDLTVGGKVTAQEFHTEFVSASVIYQSGSTQFGNSIDDTHIFTGSVNIDGTLTATKKSFKIDHPTQPGKKLIYGVLEGPEHAVYVRGESQEDTVILPEEWTGLVDESTITVQLTSIGSPDIYYYKGYEDNSIKVGGPENKNYFYFIQATRKDIGKLITIE